MTNLVERLRGFSAYPIDNWPVGTMADAADRIEELEAVLLEIANWDGNGDYTDVLKRMAREAL